MLTEPSISEDTPEARLISLNIFGLVMQVCAAFLLCGPTWRAGNTYLCLLFLGWITSVLACCYYARTRGFPFYLGLIGVFSLVGACTVLCLPKRERKEARGFDVVMPGSSRPTPK